MTTETPEQTPAERLRDAAGILSVAAEYASPQPWTYFEDHGRDYSDEGWSHVGALDANGQHVMMTYAPGYEGNDRAEHDAALAITLSGIARPLVGLLREAAAQYDAITNVPTPPLDRDPVDGDVIVGEDGLTRVFKPDRGWLVITVNDPVAAGMLDVADAILGRYVSVDRAEVHAHGREEPLRTHVIGGSLVRGEES